MDNNSEVVYLYLDDIIPNRFQPREVFNDQALKELAVSIKEHGVIQPIIVRKVENKYEIIAGERRYKASTMAGLTKIPAIVKDLDDKESSKVALIENLQRRDLTPIEEARTYQKILELEGNMTQEQLAATMGKTQSSVSNKLRLLVLPDEIQDALLKEKISERHARSLLNLEDKNDQIRMLDKIVAEKMTVRELDKEIKEINDAKGGTAMNTETNTDINNNTKETHVDIAPAPVEIPNFATTTPTEPVQAETPVEEKQDEAVATPSVDINPTVVDINQIRENSVDIAGPTKPEPVEVKDLMKDPTQQEDEFKFVPTFDFSTPASDATPTTEAPTNNFSNLFSSEINSPVQDATNLASAASDPGVVVPNLMGTGQEAKDVTKAINDIKNTITNLENSGYKINVEENDGLTGYKIIINLEK